jgi:hypothetical protein
MSVSNDQNHCLSLQLSNQANVLKNSAKEWSMNSGLIKDFCYLLMINTMHDCIQNGNPAPPPKKQVDPSLNQCCIHESTKGSTAGILAKEAAGIDNIMPICHIQ